MTNYMAEIFSAVQGGFNAQGVIDWFHRPRTQLGGRTPNKAICDGDLELVWKLALELNEMGAT